MQLKVCKMITTFFIGLCFFSCTTTETPSRMGAMKVNRDQDLLLNSQGGEEYRRRVLVLDLQNLTQIDIGPSRERVTMDWINELNQRKRFALLRPNDIAENLDLGQPIKIDELTKKLRETPAQMVLIPELSELSASRMSDPVGIFRQVKTRFQAKVRVRLFSVKNNKVIFDRIREVEVEDAGVRVGQEAKGFLSGHPQVIEKLIVDTLNDFSPQYLPLLEKMEWEGRIAMINGDRMFLNVGQVSGVQVGDLLRVYDEGPEVYDPQTGNHIGRTPGRVKGTLEVVSYFGKDGAIAVVHSGGGFRESDRVGKFE